MSALTPYLCLAAAIVFEVIGTSSLKESEGLTRLVPSLVTAVAYAASFAFLAFTLKTIPVGLAYAIWSGAGILLVSLVGMVLYKQIPDLAAWAGFGLIIAGIVVINLFSKMNAH